MSQGKILAVCTREENGERTMKVVQAELAENLGLAGDSHAGD